MPTAYKDKKAAEEGLTGAFGPANDEQRQAIANAAALVPSTPTAPVPSPIQRTIDPNFAKAESYLSTFKAPETSEQIAERKRRESQGLIDSINRTYDDELARKRELGQGRLNANNAISVLTGLSGSTEAVRTDNTVKQGNEKELQAVNNQRQLQLAQVYTKISDDATREAREQIEDARRSADEIITRRKETQTRAVENLKLMASSGLVDFQAFKSSPQSANVYKYALDSVGGSEQALEGLFMLNRPKDQVIGQPIRVGNKYMQQYQNPITGKVSFEALTLPFDLPVEYSSFQKMGDNLVAIPDGWDGDVTKLRTVYGAPSTTDLLQQQSLRLDIQKKKQELTGTTDPDAPDSPQNILKAVKDLRDHPGKGMAVGKSSVFNFIPGTQQASFVDRLNSVKSLLALPNLGMLKGAMSDNDLKFIQSAGTSLSTSNTQEDFNAELNKIISKLEKATGGSSTIITAPDGTEVELID